MKITVESSLAGCTCLITGGAGFIGSHLADALLGRGHRVVVIDNLSTGRLENIAHLRAHPLFQFVHASIEDEAVLNNLAAQAKVIFHLAAAVGVKLIVEKPVETIETNVLGTELVLRTAARHGCRVLIASSSEVYGKGCKVPFSEEDDVVLGATSRARWAYAASKMVDEFLGLAYHAEFGLPVVCARIFNTIGPRQTGRYGMVVPRFIRQALCGEPLTVYADGSQTRCFCDVRDVVEALIGLAMHPAAAGRVFNVGSTEEISILDLARKIVELTETFSPIEFVPFDRAYAPGFEDMQRRVPDITRIRELLGWEPKRSLEESLRTIIARARADLQTL
ncbi:MAG: GDP-mannose 4,6-dehydratase [Verrucomicrobiae bacterium]|nr:GDP-mannose 4,6-dehydratase [Verrucomicrobiae bacterium]MDW7979818.1 GDP-mannose 4,6-dehydratase [Verrucomicrobiales bacterium]